MLDKWKASMLNNVDEIFRLLVDLQGRGWLTRGQSRCWEGLTPSIDRKPLNGLPRAENLQLERRSINLFRASVRFFSSIGEQNALFDDIIALMVLRHYGVPTRLLDWSMSPYVGAYFVVAEHEYEDGELWAFNRIEYEVEGKKQWRRWPETTTNGKGDADKFVAGLTAFSLTEPPNWFITAFYPPGFPRQNAQHSAYTMTARFRIDHADAIKRLLKRETHYHRHILKAKIKNILREELRRRHGIWRGSLFPDSAGAANMAREVYDERA